MSIKIHADFLPVVFIESIVDVHTDYVLHFHLQLAGLALSQSVNVCRVNVYADRAFRDFRLVYGNSVGIIFLLPLISDLHLFDPQFHNVTEILFGSLGLLFRRGLGESFQS